MQAGDADGTVVTCKTTKGDLTIQVTPEFAPLGAARFLDLVDSGIIVTILFVSGIAYAWLTWWPTFGLYHLKAHVAPGHLAASHVSLQSGDVCCFQAGLLVFHSFGW